MKVLHESCIYLTGQKVVFSVAGNPELLAFPLKHESYKPLLTSTIELGANFKNKLKKIVQNP